MSYFYTNSWTFIFQLILYKLFFWTVILTKVILSAISIVFFIAIESSFDEGARENLREKDFVFEAQQSVKGACWEISLNFNKEHEELLSGFLFKVSKFGECYWPISCDDQLMRNIQTLPTTPRRELLGFIPFHLED